MSVFWPRLNTGAKSGFFGSIFNQANPNTEYEYAFQNNMDDSSFTNLADSLTKTITLPRQAFGGYQKDVLANSETACKVSLC